MRMLKEMLLVATLVTNISPSNAESVSLEHVLTLLCPGNSTILGYKNLKYPIPEGEVKVYIVERKSDGTEVPLAGLASENEAYWINDKYQLLDPVSKDLFENTCSLLKARGSGV